MEYTRWFSERLSQLRIEKGVSARDMSLSLGQSESYINKIENRRTLPSMAGFFYICDYLNISPKDFFDVETPSPQKATKLQQKLSKMSPVQLEHIMQIVDDIVGNS